VGSGAPRMVTGPASRREPALRCNGPFGHKRKTSRFVVRFGVNVTVTVPLTARKGRVTRTSTT
jgi:hypothetical protein